MKKILIVLFVLLATQNIFAQSTWVQQNPLVKLANLNSVYFINENTGWAAGDSGKVMFTLNAGLNWTSKIIDSEMTIYSLSFVSLQKGFAAGTQGKLYKTLDGGNNWTLINIGTTNLVRKILFADALTGYLCGSGNIIMKTTDGGDNWLYQTVEAGNYVSLTFLNSSTGWTSTINNKMFKTTNGGETWNSVPNAVYYNSQVSNIQFANENTGWVFGVSGWPTLYSLLTKTTDGGNSWVTQNLPSRFGYSPTGNVFFLNAQTGYACGSKLNIWKTTNGGTNWINTYLYGRSSLYSIFMMQNQKGFAVGQDGTILKTADGNGWNFLYNGYEAFLEKIQFLNPLTGWASGDGYIYRTINGGTNWTKFSLNIPPYGTTNKLCFINENTGWINGTDGAVQGSTHYFFKKTTDGGMTWIDENFNASVVTFANGLTGWAVGDSIRKTTNGGITWFYQYTLKAENMCFINESIGWVCNTSGDIYKTANGGLNWNFVGGGFNTPYINKMSFANANTGWISIANGIGFFKTVNGGINWTQVEIRSFNNFEVINENTVYAPFGHSIYKTTNGGSSWSVENVIFPDVNYINGIFFSNSQTGWIGCNDGMILKTTNGGVGVKYISSEIPDNFSLSQNYPNPFNPSTKINYELKITNYVSLKVFDLLGKEVASLVNEKQSAGSYAVDFNSAEYNLPSGIYFYTLSAGDFKETKKMVLIK